MSLNERRHGQYVESSKRVPTPEEIRPGLYQFLADVSVQYDRLEEGQQMTLGQMLLNNVQTLKANSMYTNLEDKDAVAAIYRVVKMSSGMFPCEGDKLAAVCSRDTGLSIATYCYVKNNLGLRGTVVENGKKAIEVLGEEHPFSTVYSGLVHEQWKETLKHNNKTEEARKEKRLTREEIKIMEKFPSLDEDEKMVLGSMEIAELIGLEASIRGLLNSMAVNPFDIVGGGKVAHAGLLSKVAPFVRAVREGRLHEYSSRAECSYSELVKGLGACLKDVKQRDEMYKEKGLENRTNLLQVVNIRKKQVLEQASSLK